MVPSHEPGGDATADDAAAVIPTDAASIHFYRGHFDPWQLARTHHPTSNHSLLYGQQVQEQLHKRGYRIENERGLVYQKQQDYNAKSLGLGLGSKSNHAAGGMRSPGASVASPSHLLADAATGEFRKGKYSGNIPVGQRSQREEGVWKECNQNCKCMGDVIAAIG